MNQSGGKTEFIGDVSEIEVKNRYLQDVYIPDSGMRVDE